MLDTPRPDWSISAPREGGAGDPTTVDIGDAFRKALRGLQRQAPLIMGITAAFVLATLVYVLAAEPQFTSASRIIIDPRVGSGPETPTAPMLLLSDELVVDSEVEILRSRELAGRVVDQLRLLDDPAMAPTPGLVAAIPGAWLFAGDSVNALDQTPEQIHAARRERMIDAVLDGLAISRAGSSYVIAVAYTSPERARSARIANAFVEQYFALQAEATYDNARRLSEWLSERVALLGERVVSGDRNVEDYRREQDLISVTGGRLPSEVEYEASNAQLVAVRNERGSLEASMRQLRGIIGSGELNAALDQNVTTPTLTDLQRRFAELVGRERDLSARFGESHNLARRAREEIAATRQQIIEEFEKVAALQASRVAILAGQENDLLQRLGALRTATADDAGKMIRLRELGREASSNRSLYETMLARMNETAQTETFLSAPARVIEKAVPSPTKSQPRTALALALGLFGGLVTGVGAAFLREQVDNTFRTAASIEEELGIPLLGITPSFAGDNSASASHQFAADHPASLFAETLRTVAFTLSQQRSGPGGKVVGVTAARKGEGKTVFAGNLATYASAAGAKVALIDFDTRARTLSAALAGGETTLTLARLIEDERRLFELAPDPQFGNVCVIPNNGKVLSQGAGSTDFAAGFERLMTRLRSKFDLIVIDLPPAAALVDNRIAARVADHILLAVEWGRTDRTIICNILEGNFALKSKLLGAVFTKVRLGAYHRYNPDTQPDYLDYA